MMSIDSSPSETPPSPSLLSRILVWISIPYHYFMHVRNRIIKAGISPLDTEHKKCLKSLAVDLNICYLIFVICVAVYVHSLSPVYMRNQYFAFRIFVLLAIPLGLLTFWLFTVKHSLIPIFLPPAIYSLLLPHILWICRQCFYPAPALHWGFAGVIIVVAFGSHRQAKLMGFAHLANTFLVPLLQKLITPTNCPIETGNSSEQLIILTVESALPACVAFATVFQLTALLQFDQRSALLKQQMAEKLLQAILPKQIAGELQKYMLMDKPNPISKAHSNVTVCFADLVGFTTACLSTSAEDVVGTLNRLFTCFDMLCLEHQVEKIKTIGDAYMFVGFPNGKYPEQAAMNSIRVAVHMLRQVIEYKISSNKLQLRIGAHSGPAVAGVIGCTKFCYDLWGPTVNLASRLESSGIPGTVQVSKETAKLIETEFNCVYRDTIDLKGAGVVECYLVQNDPSIYAMTPTASVFQELVGLTEITSIVRQHEHYRRKMPWMDNDKIYDELNVPMENHLHHARSLPSMLKVNDGEMVPSTAPVPLNITLPPNLEIPSSTLTRTHTSPINITSI